MKLRDKCAAIIQGGLVACDGVPRPALFPSVAVQVGDIQAMDAYMIAQLVIELGTGRSGPYIRLVSRLVAAHLSSFGSTPGREALEQTIKDAYWGARCLFHERRRLNRKEQDND